MLVPLFATRVLPLADYPNHMARLFILEKAGSSPTLSRFYLPNWHPIPNLGLELVALPMVPLLGVDLSGRVFLALAFLLVSSGTVALYRALHGEISWWPLVGLLLLYNRVLVWGFLSYIFGVGLALWAFALWILVARKTPSFRLLFALLGLAVTLTHVAAFAFLALLLSAYEIGRAQDEGIRGLGRAALRLAPPLLPSLLALAFWSAEGPREAIHYDAFRQKFWSLSWLVELYAEGPQRALVVVAFAALLALIASGRVALHKAMVPPLGLLALAYLAMPGSAFGGYYADTRLLVASAFVLVASTRPRLPYSALGPVLLATLCVADATFIGLRWRSFVGPIEAVRSACEALPRGARLLGVVAHEGDMDALFSPPLVHAVSWCVLSREAFVPNIFALEAHQPLALTPESEDLRRATPYPLYFRRDLARLQEAGPSDPQNPFSRKLLARYDFLLVVRAEDFPFGPPPEWRTVVEEGVVRLYAKGGS
jgi:hypothetical protein